MDSSKVSRFYAVISAPLRGLERELAVTVKKCFSSYLFDQAKPAILPASFIMRG